MHILALGGIRKIKDLIGVILVLVVAVGLPMTAILFFVAVDSGDLIFIMVSPMVLMVLWFQIFRHIHMLKAFPLIQLDENYLVVCEAFTGRRVFNLSKITTPKMLFKSVYFRHNGWPSFVNLVALTDQERETLWSILNSH